MIEQNKNQMNNNNNQEKKESNFEDDKSQEEELPSNNVYDTMNYKILKIVFASVLFLFVIIAVCVNKESVVFFTKRDILNDPNDVISYLIFVNICPLIPMLIMDLCLRWVREKEKTWKAKQKIEKYIVRKSAIILVSIMEAIIESIGIIIWTIFVIPYINRTEAIFLMNGLGIIPIICLIIMEWKFRLSNKNNHVNSLEWEDEEDISGEIFEPKGGYEKIIIGIIRFLLLCMQIGGIIIFTISTKLYWQIPIGLLFCSFSYWKNFVLMARLPKHWAKSFERNRYSASAIKCIVKIILIIIFGVIYAKFGLDKSPEIIFTIFYKFTIYTNPFIILICSGFITYLLVWGACSACLQRVCMALPMLLATPICIIWQNIQCNIDVLKETPYIGFCSQFPNDQLSFNNYMIIIGGLLLWISSVIIVSNLWFGILPNDALMIEKDLWSQPDFSWIFTEQHCTLNRNRDHKNKNNYEDLRRHWTFIATTMYRESSEEMKNLIMSLFRIDLDTPQSNKSFECWEAHIIFDNAIRKPDEDKIGLRHIEFNLYANQLLDILEEELNLEKVTKIQTWYGYSIETKFSGGMPLFIHMKDTTKIKQKKRWSQILYTNIIIDKVQKNSEIFRKSSCYILMIDGDTQFSKKSVDVMRDIMEQDSERIGAVCGRITPLSNMQGSNPLVWFQKFEYAAGFWYYLFNY
jgi:hypothetical protein